jgi:hypothetical protein
MVNSALAQKIPTSGEKVAKSAIDPVAASYSLAASLCDRLITWVRVVQSTAVPAKAFWEKPGAEMMVNSVAEPKSPALVTVSVTGPVIGGMPVKTYVRLLGLKAFCIVKDCEKTSPLSQVAPLEHGDDIHSSKI